MLELLERGELSEGHGRALLQIDGQDERREAARAGRRRRAERAPDRGAGAHAAAARAPRRSPSAPDWFDAELANDAVDGLYRTLGVAARVAPDRSGCRVELRLRSAAQLAGLVERLAALDATRLSRRPGAEGPPEASWYPLRPSGRLAQSVRAPL